MADIAQYLNQYQDNIAAADQEGGPGKPKRPSKTASNPAAPLPPSQVPAGGFDLGALVPQTDAPVVTERSAINEGSSGLLDVGQYAPYMESGVHTERDDLDLMRGVNQGFLESTGRHLGNFVPNVAAGIIENTGYMGALISEWGDERDYSNALTELAKSMKNPLGDVYRENPNAVWDIKDPAWWGNNFWQLAESATQFGITGIGVGSIFGKMATMAGRLGQGAATAGRIAGQVGTAATLAYTEGAMSGAEVFNRTYQVSLQELLASGINPMEAQDQAKERASNAAATTVQLNTAIATGLNMTGLASMFKNDAQIVGWFGRTQALRRQAGEELGVWTSRLRNAASSNPELAAMLAGHSGMGRIGHLGLEAFQEGTEEMVNQFAERTGDAVGRDGKKQTFFGQFAELSNFFDRTMDSEGALNFVLGAIGGVAQTAILDNVPIHRVPVVDANGTPIEVDGKVQTQLVTSGQKNAMGAQRYYNSIVDAVESDVNEYKRQTDRLAAAITSGNQEEARMARENIFDARLYNSIMLGHGDSWQGEMDRIGSLDNTTTLTDELTPQLAELTQQRQEAAQNNAPQADLDAMDQQIRDMTERMATEGTSTEASRMGYSDGFGDDAYKEKANQSKKDIEHLGKEWNRINARYNSQMEQALNYPAYIFQRRAELYRRDRIIEDSQREINSRENELTTVPGAAGTPNVLFLRQVIALGAAMSARNDLKAQRDALATAMNAGDIVTVGDLVRKLGRSTESRDLEKAARSVIDQIDEKLIKMDEAGYQQQQSLDLNSDFKDFQNNQGKGKKYQEQLDGFIEQEAGKISQRANTEILQRQKKNLELFKAETDLARESADFYETRKGRAKYLKEAERAQTDAAREKYEQMRTQAMERARQNADTEAAADIEYMKGRSEEGIRRLRLYELRKQLAELTQAKADTLVEIRDILARKHGNFVDDLFGGRGRRLERLRLLRNQLARIEQQIRQVTVERQTVLDNQAAALQQAVVNTQTPGQNPPPPPPAPAPGTAPTNPPVTTPPPGNSNAQDAANAAEGASAWDALLGPADPGTTGETQVAPDPQAAPVEEAPPVEEVPVEPTPEETEATATQIVDDMVNAEQALADYLYRFDKPVRDILNNRIDTALADVLLHFTDDIPGDIFAQEVRENKITPVEAGQLIALTRQVAAKMNAVDDEIVEAHGEAIAQEEATTEEADALEEEEAEIEATEAMSSAPEPDTESFTEKTENLPDSETTGAEEAYHMGMKAVDVNKVNNTAIRYDERKDGNQAYQIISIDSSIREGYPKEMIRPGAIQATNELILEVDEEYDGTQNVDTSMNTESEGSAQRAANFADYSSEGRITNVGEVPIKITFNGEVIGYVPRIGWLEAQYPGAPNHRNIVDVVYDADGNALDNIAIQRQKLAQIRQAVVANWDNNRKTSRVTVNETGPGIIIYATKTVGNRAQTVDGLTKNRIPDTKIQFARATDGSAFTGRRKPATVELSAPIPNHWKNVPGMLIPMYNGTYTFSPIRMKGHSTADINTVARAIELFMLNRRTPNDVQVDAEVNKILNSTGYDVRSPQGLRQFVNQYYTYTEGFSKGKTLSDVNAMRQAGVSKPFFMMDIRDNGDIKVGYAFSGRKILYSMLGVNGKLTPEFMSVLFEGLQTRSRNVTFENAMKGIRGINDKTGTFTEVQYNAAGKWTAIEHESYNDYLKTKSYTPVVGTNQLGTQYIYAVNPQVTYSMPSVLTSPAEDTDALTPPWTPEEIEANIQAGQDEGLTDTELTDIGNIFEDRIQLPQPRDIAGSDPTAEPLSLEALKDLYNFTPNESQNGKSPQQVYEEMTRDGIGQLAPGFNPFINCS